MFTEIKSTFAEQLLEDRISISKLTVDATDPRLPGEAAKRLHEHGIAFVPQWLETDRVRKLEAEFETAFNAVDSVLEELTDEGKDLSKHYGRTSTGKHLKYGNDTEFGQSCPELHECFNDPVMGAIADRYLGRPNTPNRHIILTDDYQPDDEIISYHFDEIGSLKFLLYLDNVDGENGAFQAIPGTHRRTSEIRVREWLRTDDFEKIRFRVFESFSEELFYTLYGSFKQFMLTRAVAFTASAGAMLIFDTDTLHRAGKLATGRRRRVARATSYRGIWP